MYDCLARKIFFVCGKKHLKIANFLLDEPDFERLWVIFDYFWV